MAGGDAGILAAVLHPGFVLLEDSKGAPAQCLVTGEPSEEAPQAESPEDDLSRCTGLLSLLAAKERVHERSPSQG